MDIKTTFIALIAACITLVACGNSGGGDNSGSASVEASTAPVAMAPFNADSAYALVAAQCDFGPRVPATPAHGRCAQWLEKQLSRHCDTVVLQRATVTTFDGKQLPITNFIGSINPDNPRRLLLVAHWDCRPWADNDPDPAKHSQPVMGANDAASGVAVLLELARTLPKSETNIGIDILLVDAEDWGENGGDENSWALGTQYWASHPHVEGYRPVAGILLDMVGAKGAQFSKEYFSMQYASSVVNDLWNTAAKAGYSAFFRNHSGGAITDDHVIINTVAGIPCIDVIDMRTGTNSGFFPYWHTTDDTLDKIDPATLGAVGNTLARFIAGF